MTLASPARLEALLAVIAEEDGPMLPAVAERLRWRAFASVRAIRLDLGRHRFVVLERLAAQAKRYPEIAELAALELSRRAALEE